MPYCIHCGAKLEDGQQCDCPGAQAARQSESQPAPAPQQFQQPAAPSPVASAFQNLLPFLKSYWQNPAQATAAAVAQDDLITPGIFSAVQVLAAILAGVALIHQIDVSLSALSFMFGNMLNLSLGYGVLYGLLLSVLGICLMTVMIFGLSKLMHGSAGFKAAFIACGINTIPVTILLLLTFLLGLMSLGLGFALLLLVLPVFTIPGVLVARQFCPESDSGKFWTLYIAGCILVLVVIVLFIRVML